MAAGAGPAAPPPAGAAPAGPHIPIIVLVRGRRYELVFFDTDPTTGAKTIIKNPHFDAAQIQNAHTLATQLIPELENFLQQQETAAQGRPLPPIQWMDPNEIQYAGANPGTPNHRVPLQQQQQTLINAWNTFCNTILDPPLLATLAAARAAALLPPPLAAGPAGAPTPVLQIAGLRTYQDCTSAELSLLLQNHAQGMNDVNAAIPAGGPTLTTRAKRREALRIQNGIQLTNRALERNIQAAATTAGGLIALMTQYNGALEASTIPAGTITAIDLVYTQYLNSLQLAATNFPQYHQAIQAALNQITDPGQQQAILDYYRAMAEARGYREQVANFQELSTKLTTLFGAIPTATGTAAIDAYNAYSECLTNALCAWVDQNGQVINPPAAAAAAPVAAAPVAAPKPWWKPSWWPF